MWRGELWYDCESRLCDLFTSFARLCSKVRFVSVISSNDPASFPCLRHTCEDAHGIKTLTCTDLPDFLHQLWIHHGCRHSMGCMDTQLPAYYNQTWKPTLQFFLTPIFPPNQDFFLFPLKKFYVPRLASPRFYRWQCRCRLGVNQYSTAKAAGCFCGVNYGQWKLSACFMAMASHLTFTKVKLFPILFPPPAQKPETVKTQRLGCCPKRSK